MSRPPTRRTFLSPADALEARTRLSAADFKDVSPEMLRYETFICLPCCFSGKLYLRVKLHPAPVSPLSPASPLWRTVPILPMLSMFPLCFFVPEVIWSDVLLAASWPLQRGFVPLAAKGRSGDQPRATNRLWAGLLHPS